MIPEQQNSSSPLAAIRNNLNKGTVAALGLGLMLLALFWLTSHETSSPEKQAGQGPQEQDIDLSVFNQLELDAKAAYVWDVREERILYQYNETAQLPLASLTKLVTALTVSTMLDRDDTVTITPNSLLAEGDSGLQIGEEWRAGDLLDFTLIASSNDGAEALAAAAVVASNGRQGSQGISFLTRMNEIAYEIGLKQTYFINETGLDPSTNLSGAYGSAQDVAHLLAYIVDNEPQLLESTVYQDMIISSQQTEHLAENTNDIVALIPGLIASKTGYTDLAGGNLAVLFDAGIGHPVAVVVMGSTYEGRFQDVQKLVNASLQAISGRTP